MKIAFQKIKLYIIWVYIVYQCWYDFDCHCRDGCGWTETFNPNVFTTFKKWFSTEPRFIRLQRRIFSCIERRTIPNLIRALFFLQCSSNQGYFYETKPNSISRKSEHTKHERWTLFSSQCIPVHMQNAPNTTYYFPWYLCLTKSFKQ